MADDNNKIEAEVFGEPGTETPQPADAPRPAAAGETPPEAPDVRIAVLEAEVAELKDKLLRALAETENVRRRSERQRVDATRYSIASFAREIVVVADNLRRALSSVPGDARAQDEKLETLCAGVEMTERELLNVFERFDVRRIDAMGKRFDHNFHEAMFEVDDPSQPAGTVIHVMEAGFTIGDRLLRPAKVGLAKGGPKVDAAPTSADPAPQDNSSKAANAYGQAGQTAGGKFDEKL